ncbi:MAG: FecR domain-containing protein [Thermodesulfobacteriota bacterium]|nr:FecR domain-containing protein [Thermodesulfobacteriota bacterium]
MKQIQALILIFTIFIIVLAGYIVPGVVAAQTCEEWAGKIVSVQGEVYARRAGETQWLPAKMNDTYCPGDMIQTQGQSRAAIVLRNETILRLDQKTTISFSKLEKEQPSMLDLVTGAVHFFSRFPRGLKVVTPFVNAAVEGTEFFIRVEGDQTLLSILEGQVAATNKAGRLILSRAESAVAQAGQAPVPRVVVNPRDAVKWALYYPPVLDYRPADFGSDTGWQAKVRRSIEFYWNGDLTSAFSGLEGVPEDIQDPRFFTYRAGLLLTVGCVDEAGVDIKKALNLDPSDSQTIALQSIIAVVQNQRDQALDLASKAVELAPKSPVARVALSYAQQADFDLLGALASLKEAVELGPENALAWSRLSELWLSFGDLDKALEAAKKAVVLNPNIARAQTVLGFSYLTQIKIRDAKNAFEKAIKLDQAAPLPRLGLGLAKIRHGDLKAGREEIEIATSLDPDNSLIRSYLGKAYYEEKRDKLAQNQFAMAKELDPQDPTAWFYDAIRKQTINRPVEALYDLQKSIELNDNRAVYRSKLMLDSDFAARSSSLARIYNNLGFQQRGLVEGWNSVNTDPTNFSAHRLLADSYAVLPRHEIARVSELLQSQLLQPINITPIQPALAESNLFLISAQGPAAAGFNTFNPLFNRNQTTLQASGLWAENDTWGGEGIVSGIYNKLSLSAGYSHFKTDGWRENADQDDDIANIFAQYELSYKTSLQTEYRYRSTQKGDLTLRFDPDYFYPDFQEKDEINSIRFGLRHSFSPGSIFLSSFMYQGKETDWKNRIDVPEGIPSFPGALLRIEPDVVIDEDAYNGEVQHLFRSDYISFTSGAGYFSINGEEKENKKVSIILPPPFTDSSTSFPLNEKRSLDVHHTNLYLYSHINFPENVVFTIGASADFFNSDFSDTEDRNQVNPKFGVTWNPFPVTTLRAAAFRVLKRTLITNQTLEPTQVAGFNQFYDDATSTASWLYGLALDQKFTQNIFGGVAVSKRDLDVPAPVNESFPDERVDWEEHFRRAYLYWTPFKWVALNAEYLYEKFDYADEFSLGARKVTTQRVPLGLKFFHPSGLNAMLKGTYYNQDGNFLPLLMDQLPENFVSDDERFWLFDVSLSYRLPKRYGLITVGANNLFGEEFKYYDTDPLNPSIRPDRFFYAVLTMVIP